MTSLLTAFDWTPHGSKDYRAAIGDLADTATATAPTTPTTLGLSNNAGVAAAGGEKPQNGGGGGGPGGRSLSKSLRLFDKFGSPARVLPAGVLAGTAAGGNGDPNVPQRRATHAGVVESGESSLRLNMLHFRPQEFMDPDTAAQVSDGKFAVLASGEASRRVSSAYENKPKWCADQKQMFQQ